jgi:nucleoside-diphosphate-sugar epimerase
MPDSPTFLHPGSNMVSRLAASLVDRPESQYKAALESLDQPLREALEGRRILVLGAAGFIARQTLSVILSYRPSYVGLVDISENGLAELIRSLRASNTIPPETTVDPWLTDIGSPVFIRLLHSLGTVDRILNFAAVKHVRSERDVPSLLRMLEVNLVGVHASSIAIAEHAPGAPQFVVSTDKAADPSNFMGASKRAMEMALATLEAPITTARFANVAFSSGSLLESWLLRLGERQPLAVPESTWRYFVTPEEAGQLCAAASVAPPGFAVIPQFASPDLILLEDALSTTLEFFGLTPDRVSGLDEARSLIRSGALGEGRYPYFVTALDTAGEKSAERLLGVSEEASTWQPGLHLMPIAGNREAVEDLVAWLSSVIADSGSDVTTEDIRRRMALVVPNFSHQDGSSRLDDRA